MVPGLRGGLILAGAVFSHWILDLIVHRPDLALYDSVGKMGFGLWNYRGAAFALEMAVLFGGAAILYRAAAHKRPAHWICDFSHDTSGVWDILLSATTERSRGGDNDAAFLRCAGSNCVVGGVAVHRPAFPSRNKTVRILRIFII
jgi:hypothetical protein